MKGSCINTIQVVLGAMLLAGAGAPSMAVPVDTAGVPVTQLPTGYRGKGSAVIQDQTTTLRASSGEEDEYRESSRPWSCCDRVVNPRGVYPPILRCSDEVERCAGACAECEEVEESEPRRYMCVDWYRGDDPGPRCTGVHHL